MKTWKANLELSIDELHSFYHSDFFKIKIEIAFLDSSKLGTNQEKLVNQIIEREREWAPKIIEPLITYYNKTYSDYKKGWELGGANAKTLEDVLPKEMTKEKLQKLTFPEEICIKQEEEYDEGYFGLVLGCSWDDENGLGVAFKNWEIIDVGNMDIAFL